MNIERKTVHISDDSGRIGMYEYRTQGNDNSPQELMRYIYSNNIQSSNLELDDTGNIISYEEYHPFGTTSYQATNASINAVAKRYRYTGKERDEESGLYYHGARYYIPWLCRWTQCDPIGIKDGLNVYAYCSNNPVMMHDPSGTSGEDGKKKPIKIVKPPDTAQLGSDHAANLNNARNFRNNAQQIVNNKPVKSKEILEREKAVAEHQKKQKATVSSATSKLQQERNEEVARQAEYQNKLMTTDAGQAFFVVGTAIQGAGTIAFPEVGMIQGAIDVHKGLEDGNKLQVAGGLLNIGLSGYSASKMGSIANLSTVQTPNVISSPIKGNPNAINSGFAELSTNQSKVLSLLPNEGSQALISKKGFGLKDLAALTAETGDEFAMFTTGGRRLLIRGNNSTVPVNETFAKQLAEKGWRFSSHTHPGGNAVLNSSIGDRTILQIMGGKESSIMNSKGGYIRFTPKGDIMSNWLPY